MAPLPRHHFMILPLLGALSVISPFAIDLYLPAFSQMATSLNTTSATISFSLSSYFVGLAFGQLFYGPMLDRFGRKKPIYVGLALFCLSSLGCMVTKDVNTLIALRFLQGLGGCAAQVAATAMVHDFYPVEKRAKIFSLLFLFIGASPLLAPTIGSFITMHFDWRWVFVFMFVLVSAILSCVIVLLPEGHKPDRSISLSPRHIIGTFIGIFENRAFQCYTLAGAFSFAGLFSYIAGAPIIFLEQFAISPQMFGILFAVLAFGFIGASQLNIVLLRRFHSSELFTWALKLQTIIGLIFFLCTYFHILNLGATIFMMFLFLACVGVSNPNGSALALAPFDKNAGSASALMGAIQLGVGALVSTSVGLLHAKDSVPVIGILFTTALIGTIICIIRQPRHAPAGL